MASDPKKPTGPKGPSTGGGAKEPAKPGKGPATGGGAKR